MCGRYNIIDDPVIHVLLDILGVDLGPLPTRLDVAPTESVPVIHRHEGRNQLSEMRWWLVPHWSDGPSQKYAMFNARCENLEKSRAFKGPFSRRRAVIPASSFVEWQKQEGGKQPYLIQAEDQALAFAGLWDYWSDGTDHLLSCTIVTTEASEAFRPIHTRMPVILDQESLDIWLDEESSPEVLKPMFKPFAGSLIATPVDRRIGNSRFKEMPEPIGDSYEISQK